MNEKSHGQHTGELGPEQRVATWELWAPSISMSS